MNALLTCRNLVCQQVHNFVTKGWFWCKSMTGVEKVNHARHFKQFQTKYYTPIDTHASTEAAERRQGREFFLIRGFSCHCLLPETALCILIRGAVLNPVVLWCDNNCGFFSSFNRVRLGDMSPCSLTVYTSATLTGV